MIKNFDEVNGCSWKFAPRRLTNITSPCKISCELSNCIWQENILGISCIEKVDHYNGASGYELSGQSFFQMFWVKTHNELNDNCLNG